MVCEESTSPELLRTASVESSASSSAESSFRELDDAFLQTQTRIWLGEVLHIRLDEQLSISELLADGELLFQVSKVVWKLLLAKHMDLRHIKAFKSQPFASKKNSGRYRPYSNVDSYLKICKVLGLTGIDLFSPSDVVEGRNTRRVCMCIRSFSKKLRSKTINVPDFDIVTCKVHMPKDMVECIRRNLELYQSILADSSSFYTPKHEEGKSSQGYSVAGSTRNCETYSDQSDNAKIKHPLLQYKGLHTDHLYDYTSEINYNVLSPLVNDLDPLDTQNQQRNETSENQFELLPSMESLQYPFSENIQHDCKLTLSSSCGDLHIGFSGMTSHSDTRVERAQQSRIMDLDYFEHDLLRNNTSVIGNPMNGKTPVKEKASSNAKDGKEPDLFHEENITPDVHQSPSSHLSNLTPQATEYGRRCFEIGGGIEALYAAGMRSSSREALNLGDQFDVEKNFQTIRNDKNDPWNKIHVEYEPQGIMKYKEMESDIRFGRYSFSAKKFEETEQSLYSPGCYCCRTNSSDKAVSHSNDGSLTLKKFLAYEDRKSQFDLKCLDNASCNQSEELLSIQSYTLPEFCKWDLKGKCAMTSSRAKDSRSSSFVLDDGLHEEFISCKQTATEVLISKLISTSVLYGDDVVSAAVVNFDSDNYCQALASVVPTIGDHTNDFSDRGMTIQDIGDGGERVLDMISNDVVVPANSDQGLSHSGSCFTNQSSNLECNDGHQACQHDKGPVCHSKHTSEVHDQEEVGPEDKTAHMFENLVETKEESVEMPKGKTQKKILLKSVLGAAAAFGLLFMFMHLRTGGREKAEQTSKASSHNGKEKIQKYSSRKVKRRNRKEGFYPSEKLKLK